MYKIIICDTDLNYIHRIKEFLFKSGLSQNETNIIEYYSGRSFVNSLEHADSINLVFLSTEMNDMDSYTIAKLFRKHFPESVLVFCSESKQPSDKSFLVTPFRYILKSYSDRYMTQQLKAIINEVKIKKPTKYIFASWYDNTIKLHPSEILYISKGRNCCNIFIVPQTKKYDFEDKVIIKSNLSSLYDKLKEYDFEYAHSSYIVNLNHVRICTHNKLTLSNGTELAISRPKFEIFSSAFRALDL